MVWSGEVQGRQIEVRAPFEDDAETGADPTLLRPHRLDVRIDGQPAELDELEGFRGSDDPQAVSLREAIDRVHAR